MDTVLIVLLVVFLLGGGGWVLSVAEAGSRVLREENLNEWNAPPVKGRIEEAAGVLTGDDRLKRERSSIRWWGK
jgi:hypothetical protein